MAKTFKLYFMTCLIIGITSCSSDDGNSPQPQNPQNGYIYQDEHYNTDQAFIRYVDEGELSSISVILANENVLQSEQISDLNYVLLEFYSGGPDVEVEPGTYSDIFDYVCLTNGVVQGLFTENFEAQGADMIVTDADANLMASDVNLNITSVNATTITLTYTLTRLDGVIVTGYYSGNFTAFNY